MKPPFSRTIQNFIRQKSYKDNGWCFSEYRKGLYIAEYSEWEKFYLPISVKDLTILDVGAGEGETARFFLEHGANKIICIELDDESFKLLKRNAEVNNGRMEIYHKPFTLSDLELPFDFMKMDIEGYEEELLKLPQKLKKPCVIEIHGLPLVKKFIQAGYIPKYKNDVQRHYGWFCYGI